MSEDPARNRFETAASSPRRGLAAEFWDFLKTSKKWWLLPILAVILVLGGLIVLSGTGAGPFIYSLF